MIERILMGHAKQRQVIRAVPAEIIDDKAALETLFSEIEETYLRDRQSQIHSHLILLLQAGAGCEKAAYWLGWMKPLTSLTATLPPYNKLRRLHLPSFNVCDVCGTYLYAVSPRTSVCSNACERKRQITISRDWRANRKKAPAKLAACQHCQSTFTPARADAKFCCGKCRVAAHREKKHDRI